MTAGWQIRQLTVDDRDVARRLFAFMAAEFGEASAPLADDYLATLLGRDGVWAIAAVAGDEIVGGLTAHTLPMTTSESSELFIYDLVVHHAHRRRGIGRALVDAVRAAAARAGIHDAFVPADDEDVHALDFYRAIGGTPSPVTIFTFPSPER